LVGEPGHGRCPPLWCPGIFPPPPKFPPGDNFGAFFGLLQDFFGRCFLNPTPPPLRAPTDFPTLFFLPVGVVGRPSASWNPERAGFFPTKNPPPLWFSSPRVVFFVFFLSATKRVAFFWEPTPPVFLPFFSLFFFSSWGGVFFWGVGANPFFPPHGFVVFFGGGYLLKNPFFLLGPGVFFFPVFLWFFRSCFCWGGPTVFVSEECFFFFSACWKNCFHPFWPFVFAKRFFRFPRHNPKKKTNQNCGPCFCFFFLFFRPPPPGGVFLGIVGLFFFKPLLLVDQGFLFFFFPTPFCLGALLGFGLGNQKKNNPQTRFVVWFLWGSVFGFHILWFFAPKPFGWWFFQPNKTNPTFCFPLWPVFGVGFPGSLTPEYVFKCLRQKTQNVVPPVLFCFEPPWLGGKTPIFFLWFGGGWFLFSF